MPPGKPKPKQGKGGGDGDNKKKKKKKKKNGDGEEKEESSSSLGGGDDDDDVFVGVTHLSKYRSPWEMESLGMEVLKEELTGCGLKCGGTLSAGRADCSHQPQLHTRLSLVLFHKKPFTPFTSKRQPRVYLGEAPL